MMCKKLIIVTTRICPQKDFNRGGALFPQIISTVLVENISYSANMLVDRLIKRVYKLIFSDYVDFPRDCLECWETTALLPQRQRGN